MPIISRRRVPGRPLLSTRTVGNATVVHLPDRITDQARNLALTIAPDPENDLVVVDLPSGSPVTLWEAVATALPRSKRGLRLVIGNRTRETTALAGQWLADRMGRSVVAPDGALLPAAGGSLFVHSGRGTGWVRFRAGHPPTWEAKRYPRPTWDSEVLAEDWPTSARGVAEPIPGGMWIRPLGFEAQVQRHRRRLIGQMPTSDDVISVVVGSPGSPALSLDDISRLWVRLPSAHRERVRFLRFGPLTVPTGAPFGQALADWLEEPVTCYSGFPAAISAVPEVFHVDDDGHLGWALLARELRYSPRGEDGVAAAPVLLSHRRPVYGVEEVAPAVYWYAPDAVLEVVPGGLLVRGHQEGPQAAAVRNVQPDPAGVVVVFEDDRVAERMRVLAEDAFARLEDRVRVGGRVVGARELLAGHAEPRRAKAEAHADVAVGSPGAAPASDVVPTAAEAPAFGLRPLAPVAMRPEPDAATDIAVVESPLRPSTEAPSVRLESAVTPAPARFAPAEAVPAPAAPEPPSDNEAAVTPPTAPEDRTTPPDVATVTPDVAVPPPGVLLTREAIATPARLHTRVPDQDGPAADAPASTPPPEPARLQRAPAPEAAAVLPAVGIEQERAWLRKMLGADFGRHANSVARVLSEHPGFQGPLARSSQDLTTDAVAVRLFLSSEGHDVDLDLRRGDPGPHVPFARCVVSGLLRLPSHRGPTVYPADVPPGVFDLLQRRNLVTEWGFLHALTAPRSGVPGTTDVLVWSMTGRRTKLLEPENGGVADRVLFVPGTSFKVLRVRPPEDGRRGLVLLRELAAREIGADGRVETARVPLDDLALNSLEGQVERWAGSATSPAIDREAVIRFGPVPGLRGEKR